MTWAVADMDEGILVVLPTRKACVQWAQDEALATRVLQRHSYGGSAYEYVVAGDDPQDASAYFIGTLAAVAHHGWDPSQQPVYGDPERPHERTRREDDDE